MIPEFVAQLYAAKAGELVTEAVVGFALVGLAGFAVYAFRCRAAARSCARHERERAKEIEDRERTRVNHLAEILDISNTINANLELEPLLNEVARAVKYSMRKTCVSSPGRLPDWTMRRWPNSAQERFRWTPLRPG
jgi:hypothetical protein